LWLDIRLYNNDKQKSGEETINRVDETCYQHDLAYRDAENDLTKKHEADRIILEQLNSITNPTIKERLTRLLIKGEIDTKLKLGVGINIDDKEAQANELFKDYRKPPVYLKVKVLAKNEIWSADLVEMPNDQLDRSGVFKYILIVIDLYTRYD
jgi:hypothetical protein